MEKSRKGFKEIENFLNMGLDLAFKLLFKSPLAKVQLILKNDLENDPEELRKIRYTLNREGCKEKGNDG